MVKGTNTLQKELASTLKTVQDSSTSLPFDSVKTTAFDGSSQLNATQKTHKTKQDKISRFIDY